MEELYESVEGISEDYSWHHCICLMMLIGPLDYFYHGFYFDEPDEVSLEGRKTIEIDEMGCFVNFIPEKKHLWKGM